MNFTNKNFSYTRISCGCRVTFFGESGFKTSQMDCCKDHGDPDAIAKRDEIQAEAKAVLGDTLAMKWEEHE